MFDLEMDEYDNSKEYDRRKFNPKVLKFPQNSPKVRIPHFFPRNTLKSPIGDKFPKSGITDLVAYES